MPKLKAPLFSLKATGRLGKFLTLAKRRGRHIIERRPIPTDAKSPSQLFSRLMFNKCIDLWHLLSDAERQEWESLARSRHMTGYAWYISQCLRPNPGIYLPLIGGTMSGNIDMATNRILNLPDPTTPQEPDTRFARSTALLVAIAAHASIPAAHHARYTDAEVDAILAVHAALVTGVHGAGDSILATTLNIATHTAIAAAHHARYTDAEAVTAAKTVKLDDFAAPDDNADLNASAARHGLFKKLDGVATHFLNGLGNWVAGGAATKEFFLPVTQGDFSSVTGFNDRPVLYCYNINHNARLAFMIPQDFNTVDAAAVILISYYTGNADWDIFSDYATEGERHDAHNESDVASTYPVVHEEIYAVDISGILSNLAPGDHVGVQIIQKNSTHDFKVLGVRFKYS